MVGHAEARKRRCNVQLSLIVSRIADLGLSPPDTPNLDVVDVVGGVDGPRGTAVARRHRIGRPDEHQPRPGATTMSSEPDTAFPQLTDAQIDLLRPGGRVRDVKAGDVLFAEGDRGFSFYVVLDGAVEIIEHSRGVAHTVTV